MVKKIFFSVFIAITSVGFIACNEDSDAPTILNGGAAVTSFSLSENNNILSNLDSVYFSIDLDKARIYNADSLPYGTRINKLIPVIVTTGVSVAELHIPRGNNLPDSIMNYLTNSTDSVDFSHGDVILHLVSEDGQFERDYTISVNVHQVKPDSLYWNRISRTKLPSRFNVPNAQKTVKYNGQAVCLTQSGNNYCIAVCDNPGDNNWSKNNVSFSFTPDIESLNATNDALYILDTNGNLYTSVDGLSWTSCNTVWSHIYGGYESTLLGVENDATGYYHVTYPATSRKAVAAKCPITATSPLAEYNSEWSASPQVLIIGGQLADGSITGDTWGYDGSTWVKLSNTPISPRHSMTLVPYYTYKTDSTNWSVTKHLTLIALGGFNANGIACKDVYISLNEGINWRRADDLMQLPDYIPAMGAAQALVFPITYTSRAMSSWEEFQPKHLPSWWQIQNPATSRASQAITQWECPYIYLFGGRSETVGLYNTVWRGVINRLTFKPLQ